MASTLVVLLLLSAGLFTGKAGVSEDCTSYTINREYKEGFKCLFQHCCGNCDNKYCCSDEDLKLTESVQRLCHTGNSDTLIIDFGILGFGILFHIFVIVICCPCCCIYKMCRRCRRAQVTDTNVIQQQSAVQGIQYPQYQPVLTQPGYGQSVQMRPYQGQPGAPPPYHVATSTGYPTSQSAYDKGQAMYPMQPPVQSAPVYTPSETLIPAYTPADVKPPKTGY